MTQPFIADCSHWPDPLATSFASTLLMKTMQTQGFEPIGAVHRGGFAPVDGTAQANGEYTQRSKGYGCAVMRSRDGLVFAELDTAYGTDDIVLFSLFEDGSLHITRQPEPDRRVGVERWILPPPRCINAKAAGVSMTWASADELVAAHREQIAGRSAVSGGAEVVVAVNRRCEALLASQAQT